jgi:beta-xylosidase
MTSPFSYPWDPDRGDGTYANPVIHADYSDPDVIRHGNDFWMTASSFNCTPGLPILHSLDLVNWRLVNHAIKQVPHSRYGEVQPGCGVWAPSIRHHAGKFWIFFPLPDEGIYVTTAEDPRGEWCEPWLLQAAKGWIDPCPFWEEDGTAYLVHAFANSRAGKKERIHVRPMSPDGRQLLGEGKEVVYAPHHAYLEGPKVHKLDGWYYILAPGGGVPTGWQVAFRSKSLLGTYEEKVVLEQGATAINGPHQGALVDTPSGEWWFIHFQDTGPFGRIVHLQPVTWRDGWPLMGVDQDGNGVGEPVAVAKKPGVGGPGARVTPASSDEFDTPMLGLQWQWHANHVSSWASLTDRPGWLRLTAVPRSHHDLGLLPNFLGQKYPARGFAAETLLDLASGWPGHIAGMAVVGGKGYAGLAIRITPVGAEWVLLNDGRIEAIDAVSLRPVRLEVRVKHDGSFGFRFATTGRRWAELPRVFHAGEGGWLGAKVGLFAFRPAGTGPEGCADFDYFRFGP